MTLNVGPSTSHRWATLRRREPGDAVLSVPRSAFLAPGTASVTTLLRSRWHWAAAGLAAGLLSGVLAATSGGGAGFKAESIVQVNSDSPDSNRVAQLAQSAQRLGRSGPVLDRAAEASDSDPGDLRSRSRVTWEDSTDLVRVEVVASRADTAVDEANAIADAMVGVSGEQAQERLERVRAEGNRVLKGDVLGDAQAEAARRSSLGSAVAQRQDDAIGNVTVLWVLDPAAEATPVGLSPAVNGALGGAAGLGLAALAAVVLGVGRRRVVRALDLTRFAPDLSSASPLVAEEQAGRLLDTGASALVVVAMPGADAEAGRFADRVLTVIEAHDFESELLDAREGLDAGQLTSLRRRGTTAGAGLQEPARVLLCRADDRTLELLAGQSSVISVVVTAPRASRLEELRFVAAALASSSPTVVIWS